MRWESNRTLGLQIKREKPLRSVEDTVAVQVGQYGQVIRCVALQKRLCLRERNAHQYGALPGPARPQECERRQLRCEGRDIRDRLNIGDYLPYEPFTSQKFRIEAWCTEKGVVLRPVPLSLLYEHVGRDREVPVFPDAIACDYFAAVQGHQRFVHGGAKPS